MLLTKEELEQDIRTTYSIFITFGIFFIIIINISSPTKYEDTAEFAREQRELHSLTICNSVKGSYSDDFGCLVNGKFLTDTEVEKENFINSQKQKLGQ